MFSISKYCFHLGSTVGLVLKQFQDNVSDKAIQLPLAITSEFNYFKFVRIQYLCISSSWVVIGSYNKGQFQLFSISLQKN